MRSDASNSYRSAHGNGASDDLLEECRRLERPRPVRTGIEADASGATILFRAIISHGHFQCPTGSHHHPTEPWSGSNDLATSAFPSAACSGSAKLRMRELSIPSACAAIGVSGEISYTPT